jgi:hypothetical protein
MNSHKEKHKEYFEILELEESATLADINHSFKKLKELYSSESIVTDPIEDEFTQEERQEIVNQLEEAYKALLSYIVQRDRVEKEAEKKEEEMEDTAEEEERKKEEEKIEEEEAFVLELEEEERISDNEFQEEIFPEESFDTVAAPKDFAEEIADMTVSVHENEYVHEPVHIELPDKDDSSPETKEAPKKIEIKNQYPHEDSFEIISTDVDKDISEKKADKKKPAWDETLFEKDIEEIKKELTKEITRDIKAELTMVQKKPGDQQAVQEGIQGLKIKGRSLRKIREKLGLGIHEIALKTKINYKILVNIEKERFSKLPDAGHLRYYLTSYAKALFLDPQNVADEYMKRFRQWKRSKGEL